MCDFKPGDEVTPTNAEQWTDFHTSQKDDDGPRYGEVVVIVAMSREDGMVWLEFEGWDCLFDADDFRKVQKRNDRLTIEAFSVIKDGGFEEPNRRAPAKKRERA